MCFGSGLVHQINGFIRQKTVVNVTLGEFRCCTQTVLCDRHMMMFFILWAQTAQNLNGLFHARFFYGHRLETALQRCIFFNVLTVFLNGCGTDDLNQSPGQCRFHDIGRIQRTFRATGTDDRMQLIDKQNYISCLLHFLHDAFDTLLKFTTVLCTGHHAGNIQRQDSFLLQMLRNRACGHPGCKSFHDSCFSHTRLADQARIIFSTAAQDLDQTLKFLHASDQRIQLAVCRAGRQIRGIRIKQCIFSCFRTFSGAELLAFLSGIHVFFAHGSQNVGIHLPQIDIHGDEKPCGGTGPMLHNGKQQMLRSHFFAVKPLCNCVSLINNLLAFRCEELFF